MFFWLRIANKSFRLFGTGGWIACDRDDDDDDGDDGDDGDDDGDDDDDNFKEDSVYFTLFDPSELFDSSSEPSSGLFGSPLSTSFTFRLFRGRPFSFGAARNLILCFL